MKKIVFVMICTALATFTYAQRNDARQQKKEERKEKINQLIKQEEEGALIYHKQSIFGIKLTTDGYGAFYESGKLKTPVKTNLFGIEVGERKSPKEEKLTQGDRYGFALGNPYIYGKINNFYYVKVGIGQQRLIGGKGNKNGVAVSALYGGGLSAGLLKPYYIRVLNSSGSGTQDVKYNNNDDVFLGANSITGSSGIGKGFKEMKFVPGAYAKTALRFDYGRYNESITAIEVGINVEAYTQKMPIMLLNKNRQLFFNAYAAVVFGRRK